MIVYSSTIYFKNDVYCSWSDLNWKPLAEKSQMTVRKQIFYLDIWLFYSFNELTSSKIDINSSFEWLKQSSLIKPRKIEFWKRKSWYCYFWISVCLIFDFQLPKEFFCKELFFSILYWLKIFQVITDTKNKNRTRRKTKTGGLDFR